jgi:leader peptidase (prepilin peptidase)/N-methyltransferase
MTAEPHVGEIAVAGPQTTARPAGWRLRPPVIALAAAVAAAAALRLGFTPHAIMAAGALAVLVVLSAIDLQARILPNRILAPASAVILAGQLALSPEQALEGLVAAFGAALLTLAPTLVNPAAIGMGDVKLVAFLGLLLGAEVLPAMMLGLLATTPVVAVLLVRRGRAAWRTALPLGPFLALGAAIAVLA